MALSISISELIKGRWLKTPVWNIRRIGIRNRFCILSVHLRPVVELLKYDGKDIIVLWIPGGEARPYKCPVHFPNEKVL